VIDAIVTAVVLGFFAGTVPGPYKAVVASTALERGFKPALRLAFVPLVTELPPMLVTTITLGRLNYDVLTGIGIFGGVLFAVMGIRFIVRQGRDPEEHLPAVKEGRAFWALASAGLLTPAPWVFWLAAASPLFFRAWNEYWLNGVVFALVLNVMLVGTAAALAWGASHGQRILAPENRRRILRAAGVFLILAGTVIVWQSLEGNFQRMVQQQERLRERVGVEMR
jgi:threonine/homoserine/homoserine lactone efflux protein